MKTPLAHLRTLAALALALVTAQWASAQTIWTNGDPGMTWSTALNWVSDVVPDSGTAVLFTNVGQTINPSNINNIVDSGFTASGGTIASLQFAQTLANHTTLIAAGQSLTISSGLLAGSENDDGGAVTVLGTITGGPGATLNLTGGNLTGRQGSATAGTHKGILDLSGVETLTANIARVLAGSATSAITAQNRLSGVIYLAKTNIITATGSAPAVDVGDLLNNSNNGTGSALYLGRTNAIFANTIAVAKQKGQTASMLFNPAFTANNGNPAAFFRGQDGVSRVSNWTLADGVGNGGSTTTPSATNDFSGGTVDALVDTMTLGKTSTSTPVNRTAIGTLTFTAGTIDVNSVTNGWQSVTGTDNGYGIINVNGTATLIVNTVLELGRFAGGASTNSRGVLNINGGTVRAALINANFGSISNTITMTNGTLILTNVNLNATAGPGIRTFTMTNSTLALHALSAGTTVVVTNLTTGGITNNLNIASIPVLQSYPAQFTLIKYTTFVGVTNNLGLGTLPFSFQPYVGYISNNLANTSIDLVVTAGPAPARSLSWTGTGSPAGDWDVAASSNWKTNGVATFFNQTDFVLFDDTASGTTTVNLTTQLDPTSLVVSNNSKAYRFNGGGYIDGAVVLVKQGSGTLTIDNSGANTFSGGVNISSGTVQFGANDFNGNLPLGGVTDNGTLAFNRADVPLVVPNIISGTGAVAQINPAGGTLALTGVNTFSGQATVASGGTLQPENPSALGSTNGATIVASGGTLDVWGQNLGSEPVFASGAGVGNTGAIVNNNTNQTQALRFVTLQGNTTFGGGARWDIRGNPAALLTGGNNYSITKVGANQVSLVSVTNIDPNLGDINIQQGIFAVQTATTQLGNPANTINISSGATLDVYQLSTPVNKNIVATGDGLTHSIFNENGNSFISGTVTLNGPCIVDGTGTTLTLGGNVGGSGSLTKTGGGALILNGNVSPAGGVTNSSGTLILNGVGSVPLWSINSATLAGSGTNTANVQVVGLVASGNLNPGPTNSAGTFTATAGVGLGSGATLTFDIGVNNTIGGTVNDLLQITGDLGTTNNPININPWQGRLQAGSYRLINYSGNLLVDSSGGLSSPQPLGPTRYGFALDTNIPGQVNVVVSGGSSNLIWASTSSSVWDVASSPNWQDGANPSDQFYNGDSVLLDDSVAGVTNTLTLATGVSVLPWTITNNSSANNYTITGPGKISGPASLVKTGNSTLTIFTTNDFTGPVTLLTGTLRTASSGALGATNSGTTIAAGATLDLSSPSTNLAANTLRLGFEPVTVSGAGVGGLGAIINSGTNSQQNALQMVTLAGDTSLGGPGDWAPVARPGRWDIRSQAANVDIAAATNAILSTGGQPYNLTKVGSNWVAIVGVLVDPALANINVNQGLLSIEHSSTMGDSTKSIIVTNGAVFEFWQNWPSNILSKVMVLYGDGAAKPIVINGDGANVFIGPITLNSNCLFAVTNSLTLSNNIVGGTGGLIKTGTGPLILCGANNYSGPTVVSSGTLSLAAPAGAISSSSSITLASNTIVDVTARGDATLTLAASQILSGNGSINGNLNVGPSATVSPGTNGVLGSLNVSNALTLQGTTAMDLVSPSTCDVILASGSITYGGTLSLSFTPGSLHMGDHYTLFTSVPGSYSGSFTIAPSTPGPGLLWKTDGLGSFGILGVMQGSTVNLNPTNITTVVTSSNLALSWPADHTGWHLQAQTNAAGVGLTTNWGEVAGATMTNQVFVPISRTNGSVFYRMFYPTNGP